MESVFKEQEWRSIDSVWLYESAANGVERWGSLGFRTLVLILSLVTLFTTRKFLHTQRQKKCVLWFACMPMPLLGAYLFIYNSSSEFLCSWLYTTVFVDAFFLPTQSFYYTDITVARTEMAFRWLPTDINGSNWPYRLIDYSRSPLMENTCTSRCMAIVIAMYNTIITCIVTSFTWLDL